MCHVAEQSEDVHRDHGSGGKARLGWGGVGGAGGGSTARRPRRSPHTLQWRRAMIPSVRFFLVLCQSFLVVLVES